MIVGGLNEPTEEPEDDFTGYSKHDEDQALAEVDAEERKEMRREARAEAGEGIKMKQGKLKPCPLCGGEANMEDTLQSAGRFVQYFVTCKGCDLETRLYPDAQKATEAWNTRPDGELREAAGALITADRCGGLRVHHIEKLRDVLNATPPPAPAPDVGERNTEYNKKLLEILTYHGLWNPKDKVAPDGLAFDLNNLLIAHQEGAQTEATTAAKNCFNCHRFYTKWCKTCSEHYSNWMPKTGAQPEAQEEKGA